MIESGTIIELSNNKKYIITDSVLENCKVYYLTLEVDYNTETPTENAVFFEQDSSNSLLMVKNQDDEMFLKTIFINKFLNNES